MISGVLLRTNFLKLCSAYFALSTSLSHSAPFAEEHTFAKAEISMASSTFQRWLRPEVYPLFAAVGAAVGICGFSLFRNICINPEVRVTKENRAAGILENFAEGEKYAEHSLRKLVRNRTPEIMPALNKFFTEPN